MRQDRAARFGSCLTGIKQTKSAFGEIAKISEYITPTANFGSGNPYWGARVI